MNPETVNLIANLGGIGVLIWVLIRLEARLDKMDANAAADRQQLWELLSFLVRQADSRTDIPMLPSARDPAPPATPPA